MAVLPFLTTGVLREQGGDVVPDTPPIPLSVWPTTRPRSGDAGRYFDHEGEAESRAGLADALRVPNRELLVDGVRYRIVDAILQDMAWPHIELRLRESAGGRG